MSITKAEEVNIQAVSPVSTFGAAGGATGAAVWARTPEAITKAANAKPRAANLPVMAVRLGSRRISSSSVKIGRGAVVPPVVGIALLAPLRGSFLETLNTKKRRGEELQLILT